MIKNDRKLEKLKKTINYIILNYPIFLAIIIIIMFAIAWNNSINKL